MDKNKIDRYVEQLTTEYEELENTLQFLSYSFLLKHYKKPTLWYMLQNDELPKFKERLNEIAVKQLTKINDKYKNTILLAYAMATDEEISKDDINKELVINVSNDVEDLINQKQNENKMMVANLVANVTNNHITAINEVGKTATMFGLENVENLYKQITKSIDVHGVRDNLKVTYKNGRSVDWKVYMEMNVRTTMSNEITDLQVKSGTKSKVVFWLCSQHSSCADDHIDYQGKLYFDANYRSFNIPNELLQKISAFISANKLLSIQAVKDNKPYLTTRPNCRHYFQPVSTTQALGTSTTKLLNELSMNKGKGDSEHYDALVTQRYNERQIRKWKKQMQKYEMENKVNPNDELTQKRLRYSKDKIKEWQATQRQHLKQNDYLERDYNRESNEILVNDLGYKFRLLTSK